MSENNHSPGRRSYRSARRREAQEEAQRLETGGEVQATPDGQTRLWRPARRPARDEAPTERRPRPTPRPAAPKRAKRRGKALRRVLWVVVPIASLALLLVLMHVVLILSAPKPDPAFAEREQYERINFPLYYRDPIERLSAEYEIPASLVAAVVLSESSFEAGVENRIQARGLMQLMPKTAQWIGEKLSEGEEYTFDLMFQPEENLRYGCWYLNYLMTRFDGNMENAVCAYHAGQGNVDSWLSNEKYSRDGKTLDTIPTEDTAAYAKRVLNAQQIYQRRYFSDAEGLPSGAAL